MLFEQSAAQQKTKSITIHLITIELLTQRVKARLHQNAEHAKTNSYPASVRALVTKITVLILNFDFFLL